MSVGMRSPSIRGSTSRLCQHVTKSHASTLTPQVHTPSYSPIKRAPVAIQQGSGGRSSISGHTATVFGATGFIGRYVVNHLAKQGTSVVVPYRGESDEYRHLKPMGDLGQIVPLFFHPFDTQALEECVRHSDIVYNLIGRDYPTKNFSFKDVHVRAAQNIATACRNTGVPRLVHLSSLKSDPTSKCEFLSTKAEGENIMRETFPDVTVVKTSDVYGHEDRFLHRIGWLSKLPGGVPMVNGGRTRLRPTCVSDVGVGLVNLMRMDGIEGRNVELYAEQEYTFEEIVDLFYELTLRPPKKTRIPTFLAEKIFQPFWFYFLPRITSWDIQRLSIDDNPQSLHDPSIWKYQDIGIPRTRILEFVALEYLRCYRQHDDYHLPGREPVVRRGQEV